MAALAFVGAVMTSCSSEDNIGNIPQQPENRDNDNVVTLTTTIGLNGGSRALSPIGEKTFAENETMALIYKNISGMTVRAVSEPLTTEDIADGAKSAVFTFTLVNPDKSVDVSYVYPAAMAKNDGSINYAALYTEQDGNLSTLSSKFDYCSSDEESWNGGNLPSATLTNRLAILALTLKDHGIYPATNINDAIRNLTINEGSNQYNINIPDKTDPICVAIVPTVSANIFVAAKYGDGFRYYTKSLSNKTYEANNFYKQGLLMSQDKTNIDLATLYDDYVAQEGDILTGTLGRSVKISIADGATVILDNVTIDRESSQTHVHAGITCLGDATIILKDGTTNTTKGFYQEHPGIYVPQGKTLTIQGNGTLYAGSGYGNLGHAAGIGAGFNHACGNIKIISGNITATGGPHSAGIGGAPYHGNCGTITIYGGTINATGGEYGAGIGSGIEGSCGNINIYGGNITSRGGVNGAGIGSSDGNSEDGISTCGNITISGGTVNAYGGYNHNETTAGSGIGCGDHGRCGNITITTGVTRVYAQGHYLFGCIGPGNGGTCGTVTIGGVEGYVGGGSYTYEPGN